MNKMNQEIEEDYSEYSEEEKKNKKSKKSKKKKNKNKNKEPSLLIQNIRDEETLSYLCQLLKVPIFCKSKIKLDVTFPEITNQEVDDEYDNIRKEMFQEILANYFD